MFKWRGKWLVHSNHDTVGFWEKYKNLPWTISWYLAITTLICNTLFYQEFPVTRNYSILAMPAQGFLSVMWVPMCHFTRYILHFLHFISPSFWSFIWRGTRKPLIAGEKSVPLSQVDISTTDIWAAQAIYATMPLMIHYMKVLEC